MSKISAGLPVNNIDEVQQQPPYILENDDVFVIVRAYNEAEVIAPVLTDLKKAFKNIVVVDDGSSDKTAQIALGSGVKVVRHSVNLGAGSALQTGINYALVNKAKWLLNFDADGQHQVEDAIRLLKRLRQGDCDIVIGSRFLGGAINMPWTRKYVLKLAVHFSRIFGQAPLTDAHNGLRAFTRRAAEILKVTQSGMAYATEIVSQWLDNEMRIIEVPVTIKYTEYSLKKGQSSLNAVNIVLDLLIGKFVK